MVRLNNWLAICFELYVGCCFSFFFFLFSFFSEDGLVGTGIVGRFFFVELFLDGNSGLLGHFNPIL